MTTHENESGDQPEEKTPTIEEQSGAEGGDQDAEPSLNAPDEGRPDGQE
ncbi:hypothetical protein [Nocardioides houyundeii]|nr:hypothetical protein [Nocardioides houyundeii]